MTTSEKVLNAISELNIAEDFTLYELIEKLQEVKCPYYGHMPAILKKTEIIVKNEDDSYSFTKENWWNKELVGKLLDQLVENLFSSGEKDSKNDPIQDAVNLLKSKGYKIYAPITEYVEL